MRVLAGMLVALVGAAIGAAAGVLVTYALLSGQGVNALVWAVTGVFFGTPAMLAGAIGAGLLGRALSRDVFPEMGPGRSPMWSAALYGVGASIVLAVGGPIVAAYYSSHDAASISLEGAPNPVTGAPCKKSGIRYSSALGQKVYVCFTLSADRSEYLEYGWEFGRGSGCFGGGSYSDSGFPLGGEPPWFTATIVGARASGVVEDSDVCPGKTFEWTARSTS